MKSIVRLASAGLRQMRKGRMRRFFFLLILVCAPAGRALAAAPDSTHMQHMHSHGAPAPAVKPSHAHHPMPGHAAHPMPAMAMHPLGFPMGREASGTSWMPDVTPHRAFMGRLGGWTWMAHGTAYLGYDRMNGARGDDRAFGPNMVMVMADRAAGAKTRWRLAGMFSTDAATVGGQGYPLLFQTGETWNDEPLHDHQHPHNVFSELSVSIARACSDWMVAHGYVAPVGEPALGPPAYPHRPIADYDPLSPIGHHWQDATHIAYGVVTAGLQARRVQLEGSLFNGREPGENRAEIRKPEFDSASGRLSFNPSDELALQASHGYLHRPEALHPTEDVWRTTASAVWVRPIAPAHRFEGTVVWGENHEAGHNFDSWLIEGDWAHDRGWTPFARYEWVEKRGEDLVLPASYDPEGIFTLQQLTLGTTREMPIGGALSWAVGAQAVVGFVPDELRGVYGRRPAGWLAFVRVRPASHETHSHMH